MSPVESVRYEALQRAVGDPGIPIGLLARGLGDESWRVRKEAMHALSTNPARSGVIAALAELLSLASADRMRVAACETLLSFGADVHATLVRVLASGTAEGRKAAATLLGDLGDVRSVRPLTTALSDTDRGVRTAAAESLSQIGGADAREALVAALQVSRDVATKVTCLDGLAALGGVPPIALLVDALTAPATRRTALGLLAMAGKPEAASAVIGALRDRSPATREVALVALNRLRAKGLAPLDFEAARDALTEDRFRALRDALASPRHEVVPAAMELAGWLGAAELAVEVARHVAHEGERRAALSALGAMGEAGLEALETAAQATSRLPAQLEERVAALEAMGGLDGQRALPLARLALDEPHAPLAMAAARIVAANGDEHDIAAVLAHLARGQALATVIASTLGALGPRCAETLRRFLAQHTFGVNESADSALCAVAAECLPLDECVEVARTSLRQSGPFARTTAARTLSRLGASEAAVDFEPLLVDERADVRAEALRALASLARLAPAVRPQLEQATHRALQDPAVSVRVAAIHALPQLPLEWALSALQDHAADPDRALAIAAVSVTRGLGSEVSDADRLAVLERAAEHAEPSVQRAAARALGALAHPAAARALGSLLGHDHFDVRIAAARALALHQDAGHQALHAHLAVETDPLVRDTIHEALSPGEDRAEPTLISTSPLLTPDAAR